MTSLVCSSLSNVVSRDNAQHLNPCIPDKSSSNDDSTQAVPKGSYRVVQYRRSGQYYLSSTAGDRASQSPPKRYIAKYRPSINDTTSDDNDNIEECDDDGGDYDGSTFEAATKEAESRDGKSSENATNKPLVQALRNLYHLGRTPSSDEISSFSSQDSDTPDDEEAKESPTKKSRLGDVVIDASSKSSNSNDADPEDEICDTNFSYSNLNTSHFYSEDLVVEWGSSFEETTETPTTAASANDTISDEDSNTVNCKRGHSNAFDE